MFPPGTRADIFVRYYSRKLQELAGQPIVVENKVGAAGNLATEFVARSKPDGYTVFIAPASTVLAPAHFLFKQLNYDPDKDLESVTLLATLPFILFVAGDSPIESVADLVDNLRQKGDKGSYGSSTTVGQVCSDIFKTQFGLKTIEVKYRDGLAGLNELMSHQIDFYFADPATTKAMVADGRLRPLMITSARRNEALPNIPSTTETGVSGYGHELLVVRARSSRDAKTHRWKARLMVQSVLRFGRDESIPIDLWRGAVAGISCGGGRADGERKREMGRLRAYCQD
jgi:tripartite-type tricarboxylate transporter receptor subunit TctC